MDYKILFLSIWILFAFSCSEDDGSNDPYNPDQPVELDSFTPVTGGMATRVILSGKNLGNDPTAVKVYFNKKEASVIGCSNGKMLVITPRQPGSECTISVVVGKDSVSFDQKFQYNIATIVSTVAGKTGTSVFQGSLFSEATFADPTYLAVDKEGNLFLSHQNKPHNIVMLNQQTQMVTELIKSIKPNAPTTDITGSIIVVPADNADTYYEFDPLTEWAPRTRNIIHPSKEQQAQTGVSDFKINAYKHGFGVCHYDSMVYTRSNRDGAMVKFDPYTREGQAVVINGEKQVCNKSNSDSYIVFDREIPTRAYISMTGQHCIFYFDVKTGEQGVYAGTYGKNGWRDGKKESALLNKPRQIVMDVNNELVIADEDNNCIRRVTKNGNVETVVGIPGKSGYQDGSPEDALFNDPWGLCIDNDYTIYVADRGNHCIRKLTIE